MSHDYYKILGIDKNASPEEIKRAYRELVQKYHPDKYYGKPEYQEMNEKFKQINEAYQVLSDSEKRQMYDQYGPAFEQARATGGFAGFEGFRDWATWAEAMRNSDRGFQFDFSDFGFDNLDNLFSDFFGTRTTTRTKKGTRRGRDLQMKITISFREAVFGAKKEIHLEHLVSCEPCQGLGIEKGSKFITCATCRGSGRLVQTRSTFFGKFQTATICSKCNGEGKIAEKKCSSCHGEGRVRKTKILNVNIPAGIDNGQTIILRGQGEAGLKGGQAGDLFLTFQVKPDSHFKRQDTNILSEEEISISQAILGGKIKVKTLTGEVFLKIPAGTKSGQVFRLRGQGVPRFQRYGRGDHLVTVKIKIPVHLTKKQKEIIEDLSREGL